MALSQDEIRKSAERLDQAEKTRKQIRQLSLEHPGISIEDAYAIQKAWVDMKVAGGRVVKGHKIGLTSRAFPLGDSASFALWAEAIERHFRGLRDRYESLTPREREFLALVVTGLLNKQVGAELGISEITVKAHRGQLMRKMQADSLAGLVTMTARLKLRTEEQI